MFFFSPQTWHNRLEKKKKKKKEVGNSGSSAMLPVVPLEEDSSRGMRPALLGNGQRKNHTAWQAPTNTQRTVAST